MSTSEGLGPWCRVRVLGRGGFGLVTLWRNQNTNEHIAIKCLRENELEGIIKPKHKERWCKEVEMMKRLAHKNVVAALSIPEPLANAQSTVPLLAMEYCSMGDLRQILVNPENCCGLKESTIVDILRDISSGLSYLHSCNVIHRDIKPDNIMLQADEDRVIYKLIDLGYAKELNQGSLCESFVGTVQYLAPELFTGKPYTCSVDYWSFGQVAHEIITGHRPFLPGLTPATWMKEIQNKKRSVISIVQTLSGDTIHSSSLSKVNHLSSCLREDFEEWLQLALDWDGRTRGRDSVTNEVTLFTSLNQILDKQVVRVFSLFTCEVLSYAASQDTTVANLQSWICRDIGLETDDQTLLLPSGKSLSPKANLLGSMPTKRCNEDIALYLYTSGPIKILSKPVLKPLFVRELLDDPKRTLEYPHLKRSSSDAVFVLQSEAALYRHIISALKAKVENIRQRTEAIETLYEDVEEEWIQLEAFSQFFILSHKTDLENYIELRKAGGVSSSDLVQKWIKKTSDLETRLNDLRLSTSMKQEKKDVDIAKVNAMELANHPMLQPTKTYLDELLTDSQVLYDKIAKIPKDVRGLPLSNTDMVRVLLKAIEASAKLLKSPALCERFMKIFECEDHLAKLISPLTVSLKTIKIMRQIIESTQKERQREVWGIVTQATIKKQSENTENVSKLKEPTLAVNAKFSPFHIPKTVNHDPVSPMDENMLRVNFVPGGAVSMQMSSSPANGITGVDDVIRCNNEWRYRTEDLAQSCSLMVKEMKSLNWDFLHQP